MHDGDASCMMGNVCAMDNGYASWMMGRHTDSTGLRNNMAFDILSTNAMATIRYHEKLEDTIHYASHSFWFIQICVECIF